MTQRKIRWQDANDIGYDCILLAGQSNEVGYGTGIDTTYLDPMDARIWQYPGSGAYFGQLVSSIDPLFHHEQHASSVGHATTFARKYARTIPPNRRAMLIPCAHGSTGFSTSSQASPPAGYTFAAGGGWDVSGAQGGINLAAFAVSQANAALALNPNNRLVAIVWHQGEADSALGASNAAAYIAQLDALIAYLRANITGAANVPFLAGQMLDAAVTAGGANRANINLAHIDTPRRDTRCGFFYGPSGVTDATMQNGDNLHYSAKGQRVLGANAFDALLLARVNVTGKAPVAPAAPALAQSGTTVTVTLTRPLCRFTDFTFRYSTDAGATWTTVTRTSPNIDVTATITGLTLGATVLVQTNTINEQGTSAWSASASLTLLTLPGQPTGLTVGTPGTSTAPLSWTAPGTGGAVATYLVEYKKHADSSWTTFGTVPAATLAATVTGLANTTSYDFRVTAQNAAGNGTASATATASTATPTPLADDAALSGVTWRRLYGLVKLRGAYAGSAIRVRRGSDNVEQDIGFVGTNLDVASLATFLGASDGWIKTWYDQSGNAWDMTQATTANQMRIALAGVIDTQNALPSAAVTSTTQVYSDTHTGLYAAGAATAFAVAVFPPQFGILAVEKGTTAYYGTVESHGADRLPQAQAKDDAGSTWLAPLPTLGTTTALCVFTDLDSGSQLTGRVNGAQSYQVAYSRSGHTLTLTTVNFGQYAAGTSWSGGYVGVYAVSASLLNSTQYAAAEANLRTYWGTG